MRFQGQQSTDSKVVIATKKLFDVVGVVDFVAVQSLTEQQTSIDRRPSKLVSY